MNTKPKIGEILQFFQFFFTKKILQFFQFLVICLSLDMNPLAFQIKTILYPQYNKVSKSN